MRAYLHIDNPNEYCHRAVCVEIEVSAVPQSGDCFYMTEDIQSQLSDMMLTYYDRHKDDKYFEKIYGEPAEWKGEKYFQLEDKIWVESVAWGCNDKGVYEPHITLCNDHRKCMCYERN